MLFAARFIASLVIVAWGLATALLGILGGSRLWIPLGLVIAIVGLPLVASHPWASGLIHRGRTPS